MNDATIELRFFEGSIELRGPLPPDVPLPGVEWDTRAAVYRAMAVDYAGIVMALVRAKVPYRDAARAYAELPEGLVAPGTPRPYQAEAVDAWLAARGRGVVVLPTGAGKTFVAQMAIAAKRRATLVVVPTLDLVRQWHDLLRDAFDLPVGVVGGGEHRVEALTVTTYDSAYLHMAHLGARFGMVVFDECHHLPGASYVFAAQACLAPYRLGLSATPERTDGRHTELETLIGPLVYARGVDELAGDFLSDYDTERVPVPLSDSERAEYEAARACYRDFVTSQGIRMSRPGGWQEFIMRSARSEDGRRAMAAYRRQRQLSFAAPSKLEMLETLLTRHRTDRVLVFTDDNETAYTVSERFLVPVITHQTKIAERSDILAGLAEGRYRCVATSRVLNEGVDVPDANVAVVMSGTGSVREHVQRLGRILRKRAGKQAILYELIAAETVEHFTSERRRDHVAYR